MATQAAEGPSKDEVRAAIIACGGPTALARSLHLSQSNAKKWSNGTLTPDRGTWLRIQRAAARAQIEKDNTSGQETAASGGAGGDAGGSTSDGGAGTTGLANDAVRASIQQRINAKRAQKSGTGSRVQPQPASAPDTRARRVAREEKYDFGWPDGALGIDAGDLGGSYGLDGGGAGAAGDGRSGAYQIDPEPDWPPRAGREQAPEPESDYEQYARLGGVDLPPGAFFDAENEADYAPPPPARAPTRKRTPANPTRAFLNRLAGELARGTLTATEAKDMRPVLIEMIGHGSDGLDEFLERSNRAGAECDIWSSMDDGDIEILADTLLKLGRRTSVAAGIVRMTATGYLNIQAALIILPRLWQTATWYPRNGGIRL